MNDTSSQIMHGGMRHKLMGRMGRGGGALKRNIPEIVSKRWSIERQFIKATQCYKQNEFRQHHVYQVKNRIPNRK